MSLANIKGIGPKTIKVLGNNRINSLQNLVEYYPYTFREIIYSDFLGNNEKVVVLGVIETVPILNFYNKKMNRMTFKIRTFDKIVGVTIFNRIFLKKSLVVGKTITIIGKYDLKTNTIVASDIMLKPLPKEGKIIPVYHSINTISSTKINNYINEALTLNLNINEYVPEYLKEKYRLCDKDEALLEIHNPKDKNRLKTAINYLKYEEVFLFMLKMNYLKKNKHKNTGISRDIDYKLVDDFIKMLPFKLTNSQNKCINEIYKDLCSNNKMNRLLQGDVSSGKTIVAIISLYINYLSNHQGVFMAPTEILAKQHYLNLKDYFKDYDIKIELLTGKIKLSEKKQILKRLLNNEIDILVGTHALFSEDVIYHSLGLVVTDEQHRFGVNQRSSLNNKGINPDILYLSATPIPRTYAIVLYGDMDISSIEVMPHNERRITTLLKTNKEIKNVLDIVYQELKLKHQIYVVAPLIEDSDDAMMENVESLMKKFESAFGKVAKIGMLHGKMTTQEKDAIMEDFKNNEINILISTTVIEVGVDVKNATTMVIFDSYRFGLSQLHQLRGRIGRNNLQNYCVLISDKETERLNILTKTLDGFKISEEDFRLRGGGDIFGVRQSGQIGFNLTDEVKDFNILLRAKEDSEIFLDELLENKGKYPHIWSILKSSLTLE